MIRHLRFFSERVFGVWVDAYVASVGPKFITLKARYWGANWTEKKPLNTEFYYPHGHPQAGEAFTLNNHFVDVNKMRDFK